MQVLVAAGVWIALSFAGMAYVGELRDHVVPFLVLNVLAWIAYIVAVALIGMGLRHWTLHRRRQALWLVVGCAVLFRIILLFTTPPSLSNDVYRYMWDGHLVGAGVNPYAHAVDSPALDTQATSQRALVNHNWMASPYLPAAQAYFASVVALAPGEPLAFQVAAIVCDLLAGILIIDLLGRLGQPRLWAIIYLWNPLVTVESAHGAHIDALMIALMMAALWLFLVARSRVGSGLALAAAVLTKGLPLLLLAVLGRRWTWRDALLFVGLLAAACVPFVHAAGWGMTGPLDGTGLLGALRIYADQWNYNGGLYHWLEVALSRFAPLGPAPIEAVGSTPILAAKWLAAGALGAVLLLVWRAGRHGLSDLQLLQVACVPLGAYLILTTTVHPWYVTMVVPFLPFLLGQPGGFVSCRRFVWPWLYFCAVVSLSYLTYLDPASPREYRVVRFLEYVPFYLLLTWAAWPTIFGAGKSAQG